jgi:hypothetical protein
LSIEGPLQTLGRSNRALRSASADPPKHQYLIPHRGIGMSFNMCPAEILAAKFGGAPEEGEFGKQIMAADSSLGALVYELLHTDTIPPKFELNEVIAIALLTVPRPRSYRAGDSRRVSFTPLLSTYTRKWHSQRASCCRASGRWIEELFG